MQHGGTRCPGSTRLRVALTVCASVLMFASTGCGLSADDSRAYGCTVAGKRDTAELRAALEKISVVADGFPNTVGTFNDCESGNTTGVSIDPFPRNVTLADAEASFTDEFDCGTPERSQAFGYPTSSFECTISTVRADVGLEYTDGRARAFVRPLAERASALGWPTCSTPSACS